MFGQGIYLGLDLAISIDYSPQGSFGWSKSILGEKLSCVAVCYVDKKAWSSSKKNSPESYIVVDSNADIQLKYLLVYSERTKHRLKCSFICLLRFLTIQNTHIPVCIVLDSFLTYPNESTSNWIFFA